MFRKYTAFIGIVVLLFCSTISETQAQSNIDLQPFSDLHHFLQHEQLDLEQWQIIIKQKVDLTKANPSHIANSLIPNSSVQKQVEISVEKFFVRNGYKSDSIIEELSIIAPKGQTTAELTYVMKGNLWNEEIKNVVKTKVNRLDSRFYGTNPVIFTCVRAKTSDNIKSNLLVDSFQNFTDMKPLKTLNEENFFTVSGIIHNWNINTIPISHTEKMNVQLAIRNGLGSETSITIGTPILIVEY
ncbi:hypothetical protein HNQ94_002428 [Salirhabdus euzebyi]|uniref:TATA-box binding n=1 Tax=Salirhabdus euzebyi TaxID=394506 RepID=A0A841Q6M6_9BACI|nr:YwmB family TATA-box binding protein [Salirhabdus euzebyi]MBB6453977.1 hypothetical protein [Salirhabdus euzebyi]